MALYNPFHAHSILHYQHIHEQHLHDQHLREQPVS